MIETINLFEGCEKVWIVPLPGLGITLLCKNAVVGIPPCPDSSNILLARLRGAELPFTTDTRP